MLERLNVSEIIAVSGETQREISTRYGIPNRTLQNWCLKSDAANYRKCSKYTELLLAKAVISDACIAKNLPYEEYVHLLTSKAASICLKTLGYRETEYNFAVLFLNSMLCRETDHRGRSIVRICTLDKSVYAFEDTLESNVYTLSEEHREALSRKEIAHMRATLDSLQYDNKALSVSADDVKYRELQKLFEDAEFFLKQSE